ncbi:hypothetical protein QR680_009139 [Steinernema hermaphroditum]|uniref:Uncharacterized protein n=1 Tax=Steinernema hermaphroditum TaxID=289476 RepID=A0AA39M9C4_9BILA|nr:hypothetical protein QR680_009139 [Steinernema hermaphroditum]
MSSRGESSGTNKRVEDLVPASHFLLENRALEDRESKTLKKQLKQSLAAQKKALQEMKLISESVKNTEQLMVRHLEKMAEANRILREQHDGILQIKDVDVQIEEVAPVDKTKIPVAVVKFSKRKILKGALAYGSDKVETSEEVLTHFDPLDESLSADCVTPNVSEGEEDRTTSSFSPLVDSRCSSCDHERMENFFAEKKCDRCGRTKGFDESSFTEIGSDGAESTSSVHSQYESTLERSISASSTHSSGRNTSMTGSVFNSFSSN